MMEGIVEKRIQVRNAWQERGTQGLWFVKYEDYEDHPHCDCDSGTNDEEMNAGGRVSCRRLVNEEHVELIGRFEHFVYQQHNRTIQAVESECGSRCILGENNVERWSFWICSLIWTLFGKQVLSQQWLKEQLHGRCAVQRVKACHDILKSKQSEWGQSEPDQE